MKRARCRRSGSSSLPLDRRRLFYCILYFYDDHCRPNRVFLYIYKIYNSKMYKAMSFVSNYIYTLVPLIPARDGDFICVIYVHTTMSYRHLCIYILLHDLVNARTHHRCGQHRIRWVFVLLLRGKTPIDQKDYDKTSITSL